VPLFLLVYIERIPGFPEHLTVPADDMQTDVPSLACKEKTWHALRFKAPSVQ